MCPTTLYIEAVFYDAFKDQLFIHPIIIQDMELYWFDNGFGVKKIKLKTVIDNDYEGAVLLGTL